MCLVFCPDLYAPLLISCPNSYSSKKEARTDSCTPEKAVGKVQKALPEDSLGHLLFQLMHMSF